MPLLLTWGVDEASTMEPKLNRFVVGVDGSAAAAAALRWASSLAVATSAEIVAVNSFENPWAEMRPEDRDRLVSEREDQLASEWIRPAIDAGATVRPLVVRADPRDSVLSVADAEDADLVVLGRTGKGGGPGFLHLGSVVEHAAHHASRPLAVIPSTTSAPMKRIVVGVDGSPESLRAVEWVGQLAAVTGASVFAVAVKEPILEWTPSSSEDNWRRDVERQLEKWMTPLTEAGVDVDRIAQRDLHPTDGLLGVSSARGADVLVIGTRGAGGFTGLRAGGVAMKVLHRASLPIVLVPPAA